METQNITLALPKDLLQKVKLLAVQRHTSVSHLLTQMLQEVVEQESGYTTAKRQSLAVLQQGLDLGTHGDIRWRREDLHER